ncbi:MAG TPA: hypothetical protein VNR00_18265 [Opitutus sp.]|nr:hypothetical protein [Opitutus sp.]
MDPYYVSKTAQFNGDHEVHKHGCQFMPEPHDRIYLGEFYSCHEAMKDARRHFPQVNGCYFCVRECHTR